MGPYTHGSLPVILNTWQKAIFIGWMDWLQVLKLVKNSEKAKNDLEVVKKKLEVARRALERCADFQIEPGLWPGSLWRGATVFSSMV